MTASPSPFYDYAIIFLNKCNQTTTPNDDRQSRIMVAFPLFPVVARYTGFSKSLDKSVGIQILAVRRAMTDLRVRFNLHLRLSMKSLLVVSFTLLMVSGCRSMESAFHAHTHRNSEVSIPSISTPAHRSSSDSEVLSLSVGELVAYALAENPRLMEARHQVESLRHRIPQVMALPDPTVNTTTHLAPVETAAGQQALALGISQKVVDVDRRALQAAAIHDDVRKAIAEMEKMRLDIVHQVRIACYQWLAVKEAIKITQEDLQSLAQIEEMILRQYEVQKTVSQQDVLNVQVEQSQVENELASLRQRDLSYMSRIVRLAHLPPGSKIELNAAPETLPVDANDVDQLIASALTDRPELAAQWAVIEKNRKQVCLALAQHKPDFTVGLNWIATSRDGLSPVANGDDAVLLGFGFNLPLNKSRIRAAEMEAREAGYASTAKLQSIQDEIAEQIFDTVAKLDSSAATLDLLMTDIIPKTERSLELSIQEYSQGDGGYTQLMANWRKLLRYRIAQVELMSQRQQLAATLTRQIGQTAPETSQPAPDLIGPSPSQLEFESKPSLKDTNQGIGQPTTE